MILEGLELTTLPNGTAGQKNVLGVSFDNI